MHYQSEENGDVLSNELKIIFWANIELKIEISYKYTDFKGEAQNLVNNLNEFNARINKMQ